MKIEKLHENNRDDNDKIVITKNEYNNLKEKEQLLDNILPYNFSSHAIKNKKKFIRQSDICVLFTDIVSYCKIAKTYMDIITFMILRDMYTKFDNLIQKYPSLQKIETIGDSYMVIGDMYKEYDINIVINEIIHFAENLLLETKKIIAPSYKLQLRIGIHIGSVIIGILGTDKPRLCVVGNTVNIAARLQSSTLSDTIQISETLYSKISDENDKAKYRKKENVELKNICSMNTYIIENIV